jgi:hypothetical protein
MLVFNTVLSEREKKILSVRINALQLSRQEKPLLKKISLRIL